jgi:PAS domain S-box-containing protein
MRIRGSISFRLSLILTSIVVLVSGLFIFYHYIDAKNQNRRQLETRADEYINVLASSLLLPVWHYDKNTVINMGTAFLLNDLVVSLAISDANHELLFTTQRKTDNSRSIARSRDLYYKDLYAGNITIALTTSHFDNLNRQLLIFHSAVIVFIVIFVALATNIVLRIFIGRPLNKLNALAKSYGSGNYEKAEIPETYQEFQGFNTTMKEMGDRILEQMNTIRKTEGRYKDMFNQATEGIFQISEDWSKTKINPAMARILGFNSPREAIDELFHEDNKCPETRAGVLRIVELLKDKHSVANLEYPIHQTGGDKKWILLSGRITKLENDPKAYYEGSAIDITPRIHAKKELESLKVFLNSIVDSMPSILIAIDSEANITLWNKQAEKATGISYDKALGKSIQTIFPELSTELSSFKRAIQENKAQHFEKLQFNENGRLKHINLLIYPLNLDGIKGAVVRIDDVSERIKMEKAMIQTEKIVSVGGLAAGIAHEINNPLGVVMIGLQTMERRLDPKEKANQQAALETEISLDEFQPYLEKRKINKLISNMKTSVSRASRIITNMLHFSRQSESQMAHYDLNLICENAIQLANTDFDLKKKFDFKRIEIIKQYEPQLEPVRCTETEVEQVILNLLKNAAYATNQTAELRKPSILIKTSQDADMSQLEIADNGPGMDEETRLRVFEPFFTTKPVGSGTGLGLSVSYMIITQNHQGAFEVESEQGKGTRFIIRFPRSTSE